MLSLRCLSWHQIEIVEMKRRQLLVCLEFRAEVSAEDITGMSY